MAAKRWLETSSATCLLLVLAACGGGGGGIASTPPLPIPAPTPTPLVAPALTTSPTSPVATVGGPNLDNPGIDTVFPLLHSAVGLKNMPGDAATTNQGATLKLNTATGRQTMTINNLPNVVDRGTGLVGTTDYFLIQSGDALGKDNLDYTLYGYWYTEFFTDASLESGAWLGGYVTAPADLPLTGSANFSGHVTGLYYDGFRQYTYLPYTGAVSLSADFAARTVRGTITGLTSIFQEPGYPPLNDIGFTASLDRTRNLFTGTTSIAAANGPFAANAAGDISGRFFGPAASEVGAVWTLSDDARRLIGSFGARQNPR